MTSSHKHVALNSQAPEFFPSPYPCYVFFLPHFYPFTLYNINNYQQTHLHHAHPTPPPPPPTAAPPQASHNELKNQEMVRSHQRRRFGGACSKNRPIDKRVQLEEEEKGFFKFGRDKVGNENDGENGSGAACRVVKTCVMLNRRPKPIMPLRYGAQNVDVDADITTVMIRNVPNKLTRDGLLTLLDEHCMLMNEARIDCKDLNFSAYDFVYLPIDFKTGVNKGYAFVNFTNKSGVKKFHNVFHNKAWYGFKTPKICEIVCAKIQGKEELVKHFGGTLFICSYDEYLPLCFSPPRDGSGKAVGELIVGKRSSQNLTEETKKKWNSTRTRSWGTRH